MLLIATPLWLAGKAGAEEEHGAVILGFALAVGSLELLVLGACERAQGGSLRRPRRASLLLAKVVDVVSLILAVVVIFQPGVAPGLNIDDMMGIGSAGRGGRG